VDSGPCSLSSATTISSATLKETVAWQPCRGYHARCCGTLSLLISFNLDSAGALSLEGCYLRLPCTCDTIMTVGSRHDPCGHAAATALRGCKDAVSVRHRVSSSAQLFQYSRQVDVSDLDSRRPCQRRSPRVAAELHFTVPRGARASTAALRVDSVS
jgi:hypothetical protein